MQDSWQTYILNDFIPQVARLTLVADPDNLVTEEAILQKLRERGFEILLFEDPVAFRFAYESRYRSEWDNGQSIDLVVVTHEDFAHLRTLPYDIFQTKRKLSFSLADLFPNLSYSVIKALDRGDLDALYHAQVQYAAEKLGENATKDFLLTHVFELDTDLIRTPSDLLRVLLRRHIRKQHIPEILESRFIQALHQSGRFEDWPLERIVPDSETFLNFLQERWPIFIRSVTTSQDPTVYEVTPPSYALKYPGLANIPFGHDDVRVYIDTLFLDGLLQPILYKNASNFSQQWISVGLHIDPEIDRQRRLEGLITSVNKSLPTLESRYQDWLIFASRWAELIVLRHETPTQEQKELEQQFYLLQKKIDTIFQAWIMKRYGSLYNLPSTPPIMLHHVAHDIAQHVQPASKEKVALIIVDGLALDQWIILRNVLNQQRPNFKLQEATVFAWIPTITSVSRQSIFAGKLPLYYPGSIFTTSKEPELWKQFWNDKGISQIEIVYKKGLGEETNFAEIEELLSHPKIRVAGLVIDKVDKIVHGMELGTAGMHNQVRQWALQGFMANLLDLLFHQGFDIFITSDHGNIEISGYGSVSEGAIADLRGTRARVYSDTILRERIQNRFPDAISWPPLGLPESFLPLLAPNRSAFIREGERVVGHGGISVEELIVPYIRIERKAI